MSAHAVNIEYVDVLYPIFTIPKRIKIIVGGRGSTKSTGVADYVAGRMTQGELWCCAREHLNSIEESVHRTLLDEIDRLELEDFKDTKTSIVNTRSGGRAFYKGLARNPTSLKSTLTGIDGLWIEEGEDLSANTLRVLTASVRLNAAETQKAMAGEDVKMPEVIITMNRGSRSGAVAKKWLERAEKSLERAGYYEDDLLMVVELNYPDMPEEWFMCSGLEQERLDDLEKMSYAQYRHKWLGAYLESIEGAIIQEEWFNAAIDAHKIDRLKRVFRPRGAIIAAHDPSGMGDDVKGMAIRHGSIITYVDEMAIGDIDDGADWAMETAKGKGADWFVYDADGPGSGLKRQISDYFKGTNVKIHMFRGSLSGIGQDNAGKIYMQSDNDSQGEAKKYEDEFKNNRAQYYYSLALRFFNTYRCVEKGDYVDPDEMISLDSSGIENMQGLRSELCRIPEKERPASGLKQILSKPEMKKLGIKSPNVGDSVMMSLFIPVRQKVFAPLDYPEMSIV